MGFYIKKKCITVYRVKIDVFAVHLSLRNSSLHPPNCTLLSLHGAHCALYLDALH